MFLLRETDLCPQATSPLVLVTLVLAVNTAITEAADVDALAAVAVELVLLAVSGLHLLAHHARAHLPTTDLLLVQATVCQSLLGPTAGDRAQGRGEVLAQGARSLDHLDGEMSG